eukprot:TRINITY_DN7012_c0_g2_i1.p1 TRINITY_DN7012_c0_g2~~TRINITY_DN7012_c0_g2_i1.p1  ORF type:complete len:136 (+),score=6.29 TRINITY_DN7012_c0_g2_i1:29-409(+)
MNRQHWIFLITFLFLPGKIRGSDSPFSTILEIMIEGVLDEVKDTLASYLSMLPEVAGCVGQLIGCQLCFFQFSTTDHGFTHSECMVDCSFGMLPLCMISLGQAARVLLSSNEELDEVPDFGVDAIF